MTHDQLTLEMRGGIYLDNNGKVAGGGYYRVEIIAQLFGVTVRRIQQLTQEGVLPTTETTEGRRYDLVPTIQSYVKYLSDKAYGKNRSEKELELREQKMKADIALKESQGELHRLKTEIAAGKYISVEEVQVDYSKFFVIFKKFALSIPSKVAGIAQTVVDPVIARSLEKDLTYEVTNLLQGFVVAAKVDGGDGERK